MNSWSVVTPLNVLYPANLKFIQGCPPMLYMMGNYRPIDQNAVAVVGSRNMTNYGRKITIQFVKALCREKITIVSGFARGIDTIAHKTALDGGGRTLAVLGSGLDVIYPPENTHLLKRIINHGAVISEFPPGTQPLAKNFLARNRVISGLSKAVIIVEGARKSGTISTATHAANQGREVFAVPGPVDSVQSQAPLYLIDQGAQPALTPKDVIEYIKSQS